MRKSISTAFFSMVSTLMVLGIVLMGASEWVLFKNYFAKDRYETLDQVVGVTQRTAQYLVQQAELPEGDELDALSTKLEIIGESAEAYLFFTDNDGRVMIASSPDKLESLTVPEEMMEKIGTADADYYHVFGTLDGMLDGKSYITVSEMRNEHGQPSGYLFLCSSGEQLTQFKQQFWSNFLLSACVMLLCASILTKILMRQLTDPLQKVTDAAQRFGGGDLSVRVEGVEGEGEVADLARTFNRMADNIQMNDNSRGQFMGNIAHELRTPMTTIKGFVDGILDGTIPPDMQNHYLQLVSEETGRLARLIQNMLDLSKLESGEYQVNARMFNIWETLTGVALSAEQRINDGMIDIDGLTMDEKVLVYADPDLIHQVVYNLLDNAIEACLKLEEAKRRIEVSVLRDEAYADGDAKLYVSIINTSLPVHIEKDCIATTKPEPHLHGFGLPCAKELLRRNNAFYTMDYHDGAFQFCFEWPDVARNSCVHA